MSLRLTDMSGLGAHNGVDTHHRQTLFGVQAKSKVTAIALSQPSQGCYHCKDCQQTSILAIIVKFPDCCAN